jgi:hypothetical protein
VRFGVLEAAVGVAGVLGRLHLLSLTLSDPGVPGVLAVFFPARRPRTRANVADRRSRAKPVGAGGVWV